MIRTGNLTKRYRRNEALHGLTLDVPEGSVFALVGPNGAGKSTAIKIAMNLIRPDVGYAEVLGVDSRKLGAEQLAQIGYVSENQKLPEWMRVDYFLEYCKAFYPAWDPALAAELVRQYTPPAAPAAALARHEVKAALAASLAYRLASSSSTSCSARARCAGPRAAHRKHRRPYPEPPPSSPRTTSPEIESFATHVAYLNEAA